MTTQRTPREVRAVHAHDSSHQKERGSKPARKNGAAHGNTTRLERWFKLARNLNLRPGTVTKPRRIGGEDGNCRYTVTKQGELLVVAFFEVGEDDPCLVLEFDPPHRTGFLKAPALSETARFAVRPKGHATPGQAAVEAFLENVENQRRVGVALQALAEALHSSAV